MDNCIRSERRSKGKDSLEIPRLKQDWGWKGPEEEETGVNRVDPGYQSEHLPRLELAFAWLSPLPGQRLVWRQPWQMEQWGPKWEDRKQSSCLPLGSRITGALSVWRLCSLNLRGPLEWSKYTKCCWNASRLLAHNWNTKREMFKKGNGNTSAQKKKSGVCLFAREKPQPEALLILQI